MAHKFHGSIRDIEVMRSAGDLNFVTIRSSLACKISSCEVLRNKNATVVIDCVGSLVAPVWIFMSSEMIRAFSGKRKIEKKNAADGKSVPMDVLNFHWVLSLWTGPFLAYEAVVVYHYRETRPKRLPYIIRICRSSWKIRT